MNHTLQQQCDLFIENRNALKDVFKWSADGMATAGAAVFTVLGKKAPTDAIQHCEALLKERTGMLSDFRGTIKIPLLCKMVLSNHPEEYFETVDKAYRLLNQGKLGGSSYRAMAALIIADTVEQQGFDTSIARTNEVYAKMKNAHKWLTSDEDLPFAAMLAVSGMDATKLIAEAAQCNDLCKDTFRNPNARQSLSHVLALSELPAAEKSAKASMIWRALKEAKHKYGTGNEIALLGNLASLSVPVEQLVKEIIEVEEYFKEHKGFGDFSMGANARRMMAALMVMNIHQPWDQSSRDISLQASLMMVIQMEICLLILTSAMVATTVVTTN